MEEQVEKIVDDTKNIVNFNNVTIISQNCIGGVLYHDIEQEFLSPTINLFFYADDFIKFITNIKKYIKKKLITKIENKIVIGQLGDVKIIFLHYDSEEQAQKKWKERVKRINYSKIFIISTDRDGFNEECYEKFKNINHPKALITANYEWSKEDFCIYIDKYKEQGFVGHTIPNREFYKDNKLIDLINRSYGV